MGKRGIKGITTTASVVLAIVTLIIGLGIGMVAYPVMFPSLVPELEARIDELETTIDGLEAAIGDLETELAAAKLTGPQKIGALMCMTGELATYGENEKLAAELAVSEVNAFLEAAGEEWSLELVVEDTQTDPAVCLDKVESLAARGIKLLIGPLSSGEVSNIMAYCNAEKILAISQSSTAPALAADDFIFRYCPNDYWQGRAIARLLWESGIRYVVPTWRSDAWGDGLEEQGRLRFEVLGGNFSETYVRYSVPRVDFSVEVSTLNDIVTEALATRPADEVAVWAITFEEIAAYMDEARAYPNLRKVRWFGSDGATNTPLLVDPAAPEISSFVVDVNFISPIFSPLPATWKYDKVRDHVNTILGREPDSYSYNIYDMVWAYTFSLAATRKYDAEAIRAVFPTVVKEMYGAAGWVDLDENGDRKPTDYELWIVEEEEPYYGVYKWKLAGMWNLATDTLTWL